MSAQPPNAGSLNDNHRKVVDVMKKMGATSVDHAKSADDIMKVGKLAKGQMLAWMQELERMKVVVRVARNKAAGYYLATAAPATQSAS